MPRILWQNTDITWLAALVVLLVIGLLWLGYRLVKGMMRLNDGVGY